MASEPGEPEAETLATIFEQVAGALAKQFDQIQILNSRAQQLLGFAGVTLGVVVAVRPPHRSIAMVALEGMALLIFGGILWLGSRAWSIVGWRGDPEPRALWERYRLWPDSWLRQQLILNWIEALDRNQASIDAKVRYLRLTQGLLGLEVLYLVVVLIVRPYVE